MLDANERRRVTLRYSMFINHRGPFPIGKPAGLVRKQQPTPFAIASNRSMIAISPLFLSFFLSPLSSESIRILYFNYIREGKVSEAVHISNVYARIYTYIYMCMCIHTWIGGGEIKRRLRKRLN